MNELSAFNKGGAPIAEALQHLSAGEWSLLYTRLVSYAESRMIRLVWRGVRGAGSKESLRCYSQGKGPEDIVGDVLEDVILGKRAWKPQDRPELFYFLQSCVRSEISHLVTSKENTSWRAADVSYQAAPERNPGAVVEAREWLAQARSMFMNMKWQDDLGERIFECLESGITKPAEIAAKLKVEVARVYRAKKRILRELRRMRMDL